GCPWSWCPPALPSRAGWGAAARKACGRQPLYDVWMSKVIYLADRSAQRAVPLPQAVLPPAGQPALDTRARPLRDLRISVTDRCNFRCTYCMLREVFDGNYAFMPQSALLSFEEITRLAGLFAQLGVEK